MQTQMTPIVLKTKAVRDVSRRDLIGDGNYNNFVRLNKENLELDITKKNIPPLNNRHQYIINKTEKVLNLKGKFLELLEYAHNQL